LICSGKLGEILEQYLRSLDRKYGMEFLVGKNSMSGVPYPPLIEILLAHHFFLEGVKIPIKKGSPLQWEIGRF
jgi:hypothetical protein